MMYLEYIYIFLVINYNNRSFGPEAKISDYWYNLYD